MNTFDKIEDAIKDISEGKVVIVLDDEDRENEGDFIAAADLVTPEMINFMARVGRGLICTPLTVEDANRLELPLMVNQNNSCHETAFTVSIDSKNSGTGISAFDRSKTIEEMVDPSFGPETFLRPGHIFPLIAKPNGVLERPGHTEAAVDLARLAGRKPMGIICEIMSEDGSMARADELFEIAKHYDLKIITIKDLIEFRVEESKTKILERVKFPNKYGDFDLSLYENDHIALTMGNPEKENHSLVRIHSECLTGDVFGSKRCDCGEQLDASLREISENGSGVLVYLKQEGRGIGLSNKIKAYKLQEEGFDTVSANEELGFKPDLRNYKIAAEILSSLGVFSVDLMTNNPLKLSGIEECGIHINRRVPIEFNSNKHNKDYMFIKKEKMGHILNSI
ncbi:MAG: bifunctional 3,4-dihydroxy-2-butanone-4-phosphate synthase/GTP cyclohydrolase II [Halobacteriovorax sp.]|nr:bifunctional 3,4-dihydroxy-2-butanone-4-phosphate synthase/GTP cyclohydrolase II [Halobacteriovorax sp.]|tara:strand:+ start:357408 stop:358592 length:1185 start_codon:yes stop_codon:yes gene_type:complete